MSLRKSELWLHHHMVLQSDGVQRQGEHPSRPPSAAGKFVERRPLDVEPTALKKCYGLLSGKHRLRHLVPVLRSVDRHDAMGR